MPLDYKIISLDEIKVIGIEARTSNATAQTDIPKLWQKFYSENIKDKIPNKTKEDVLSLYTEYEGDYTKPYTIVLCCKVKNFNNIPIEMVAKTIPPAKYAAFNVKGKMPDSLIEAWQYVWSSNLDRAYKADFDLYAERNEADIPEVDIYVGIK